MNREKAKYFIVGVILSTLLFLLLGASNDQSRRYEIATARLHTVILDTHSGIAKHYTESGGKLYYDYVIDYQRDTVTRVK